MLLKPLSKEENLKIYMNTFLVSLPWCSNSEEKYLKHLKNKCEQ